MKFSIETGYPRPVFPKWAVIAIFSASLLFGLAVFLLIDLPGDRCLFKHVTHIPCPTCGITRGVIAAARGDILYALRMNPFIFVGGLFTAIILVLRFIFKIKISFNFGNKERIIFWLIICYLFIANWIFLIIDKR